ncbi:hypothetical protein F4559_000649 [Saccharothrix violaceirubra]|uniref:Uncharacterized protein n=1 Tax=Saccharothrix violaceirubra TaxID=413306 RepID=A0A7W7WTK9_9PSEU|nr:hypothetical protein [Saccharothrix violaceirubra]
MARSTAPSPRTHQVQVPHRPTPGPVAGGTAVATQPAVPPPPNPDPPLSTTTSDRSRYRRSNSTQPPLHPDGRRTQTSRHRGSAAALSGLRRLLPTLTAASCHRCPQSRGTAQPPGKAARRATHIRPRRLLPLHHATTGIRCRHNRCRCRHNRCRCRCRHNRCRCRHNAAAVVAALPSQRRLTRGRATTAEHPACLRTGPHRAVPRNISVSSVVTATSGPPTSRHRLLSGTSTATTA